MKLHIIGPVWGKLTGDQWISCTKACNVENMFKSLGVIMDWFDKGSAESL